MITSRGKKNSRAWLVFIQISEPSQFTACESGKCVCVSVHVCVCVISYQTMSESALSDRTGAGVLAKERKC